MKKMLFAGVILAGGICVSQAVACGIQGRAVNSDGSKIDGTATISTSWNSKKAYPKDGRYVLEMGNNVCGETITVYIDGNQGKKVKVKGMTTVNFVRR